MRRCAIISQRIYCLINVSVDIVGAVGPIPETIYNTVTYSRPLYIPLIFFFHLDSTVLETNLGDDIDDVFAYCITQCK